MQYSAEVFVSAKMKADFPVVHPCCSVNEAELTFITGVVRRMALDE